MALQKKKPPGKPAKKQRRTSPPNAGPDGLTLPQRIHRLMVERNVGQTQLARMCSEFYASFVPKDDEKVKQQHIFNLLAGQSNAWCLPLIAAVFEVSDLWLQLGIGGRGRYATQHDSGPVEPEVS